MKDFEKELRGLELLKERVSYDAMTGKLLYTRPVAKGKKPGDECGSISSAGYLCVTVGEYRLLVHRFIYWLHTGEQPALIDHKDENKTNNKIENLRPLTNKQNVRRKSTLLRNNKSGVTGVSLCKDGKWRAYIKVDGVSEHLGTYIDKEAATAARKAAEEKYRFKC